MIPRPATRRVSDRRARTTGATAARARGAFPFPARPDSPRVSQHLPHAPAGRGILFTARAFASSVPFGRTRRASSSAALAESALGVLPKTSQTNWTHPGGAAFSSDPAMAQRETVAPASRRPAAWRGPFHCTAVATAVSVPAEQPKDEATRRIDGAVQVATETRSAARPTGRRIVAGETSRGGGRMPSTPRRSPGERLSPLGLGPVRWWGFRRGATRRTDDRAERRAPF